VTFARPEYLGLLAAVPVCAVFLFWAGLRRRALAAFFPHAPRHRALRLVKAISFLAGLACVALGAAGPSVGRVASPAPAPAKLRLVVALDCSRSMLARDLPPDRLGAAKGLVREVLAGLPQVAAGLVGFSGRAWLACPVTDDRPALALFLESLSPADAPLGGTSVPAALEAARLALAGAEAGAILLVTDGEDTLPVRDAAMAAPGGVPVFAVAVGGAVPVAVPLPREAGGGVLRDAAGKPVLVGVDAAGLEKLAQGLGGRFFRLAPDAPNPAGGLVAALGALAPKAAQPAALDVPVDRSALCYAAGLALLLLDVLLVPAGRSVLAAVLLLGLCVPVVRAAHAADTAGEHVTRGIEALAAGDAAAALDAFLAARVWRPQSPEILYDIGTAYYRLGRFDDAARLFARAAASAPSALRARALFNQGNALCRQGDAQGAAQLYQAALASDPADADAKANLDGVRGPDHPCAGEKQDDAGAAGKKPGETPDPAGDGEGRADAPGQAPAPADDGAPQDGKARPEGPALDAAAAQDAGQGPADVPVPGAVGQKAGEKQARTAGKLGDPVLDRVPDLTGLPAPPQYGRPSVEKDW
jgi:Ca-activated chloride channel family protein